jgi:hypothetical protein
MLAHGLILIIVALFLILIVGAPAIAFWAIFFRVIAYGLIIVGIIMLVVIPLIHYLRRNT